jgi:hypothetical protein
MSHLGYGQAAEGRPGWADILPQLSTEDYAFQPVDII